MPINVPGLDAADLRRYINLDLHVGNFAPAVPAVPAPAAAPALPAVPALPLPAVPAPAAAFPLPAAPVRPLPAGSNAPAVVAAPVVEQPVPSWPHNPKRITNSHQALTIWPSTSNKSKTLNYVQGKYELVRGGGNVVGSRDWLRERQPGARQHGAAWFLVSLLGRNGWTNNRVIVDAYTRMFESCVDRFAEVVGDPEKCIDQWRKAEALVRQTLSKSQYNNLFINKNDASIVGDEAAGGECLWRLRQPGDPDKPVPTKGRRGSRSRGDRDGDGPAGDPNSAYKKRDGGPEDQPAAKKRKGLLTGG
ncbi:uncharacterized protein EAE97_004051 [Botrytis byssoidea]|uniref:Uncharacterized protein n=1 Tax=Botrytis byssoidea TaxID=139641 RepID=A0A9P5IRW5_9HELO|nr:uncharacterized protein EAE97_004051 [Botrytis byssoidea]KAF7948640.1 hypothetical protein EAE97_004051 [Botrytis byssoidea]